MNVSPFRRVPARPFKISWMVSRWLSGMAVELSSRMTVWAGVSSPDSGVALAGVTGVLPTMQV